MLNKLVKASVVLILLYIGLIILNSYNAYNLRSNTSKILFSGYFEENRLPHILIPRLILYKAGSNPYNLDILRISKKKKNTIDCYFIENLERKTEPKSIIKNLHELVKSNFGKCIAKSIALDPRIKLVDIVTHQEGIYSPDKSLSISSFISSLENQLTENEQIRFLEINDSTKYYDWISDIVSMSSATSTTIDYHALFNKIESSMDKWQKNRFLIDFATKSNYNNINQLIKLFEENKEFLDKDSKDQLLFSLLYKSKFKKTWMIDYFRNSESISSYLSVSSIYSNSKGKLPWVNNDLNYLHDIAKLSVSINSDLASHVYHTLLHEIEKNDDSDEKTIEFSEEIKAIRVDIERILTASNNGRLKKNLIVLATRHPDSKVSYETVDDAFSEGEPRTFLFTDENQYVKNSTATKTYENISENLYISSNDKYRVWPIRPYSNLSQENILSKIPMWEEFIKKYPFHPGIDDAYLRVAFDLYNTEQFFKSFKKISEYFSKDISHDISAEARIKGLLAHTLNELEYKDIPDEYKVVKYMYEMAYCIIDKDCKTHDNINLINIDEGNLKRVTFLEESQIKRLLELAKLSKEQIFENFLKNQDDKNTILGLSFIATNQTLSLCMALEECDFLLDRKQCFSDDYLCSFLHKPVY